MQKSLGLAQVDEIYLTHFHADHMLGLPGLLKTYDLTDREAPLRVFGPPGLKELFTVLRPLIGRLRYPLELEELKPGERVDHDEYAVESYEAAHNVRALGWALVEDKRPGRFDPATAKELGVREGPDFARLQRGEEVEGSKGTVTPGQVMGETRDGRIIVVTGDTAPSAQTVAAAADADLLIHDSSFMRGGRPAGGGNRPLDRRPGRRGGGRGARETAGPRPHLRPLPRRQGARGGPRGLPELRRPPRFRPDRPAAAGERASPARPERSPSDDEGSGLRHLDESPDS